MSEAAILSAPVPVDSGLTGTRLADALRIFNSIVERKATAPILECVRIVADGRSLAISGTDLDHQLISVLPYTGLPFATATRLSDLLVAAEAFGEEVPTLAVRAGWLTLSGAAGCFELPCLDAADYFGMQRPAPLATVVLSRASFISAIEMCRAAVATEETRYYLNGICLTQKDGHSIEFAATDGHRLHAKVVPALVDGALPPTIVQRSSIRCLRLLLDRCALDDIIVEFSEHQVVIGCGAETLQTKPIDETFPAYDRLVPETSSGSLKLFAGEALETVQTINKVHGKEAGRWVAINPEELSLRCATPESTKFSRTISGEFNGKVPKNIGFSARYLTDVLATHAADEAILHFADESPSLPVLITFAGDDAFRAVLMPMRI